MTTDIIIHKNSYSKIHSAITHACTAKFENVKLINLHNRIYDTVLSLNPKTIVLQIEEYSQEIHQFIYDKSLPNHNIVVTIDNVSTRYAKYIELLTNINNNSPIPFRLLVPSDLYPVLLERGIHAKALIGYDKVYNNYVFQKQNLVRNNKILCILDDNPECINMLKPYLYPNTKKPIVMINNPNVAYDQNIGLLFDNDLCVALNTYAAVLDLSKAYSAEIALCEIPAYNITDDWIDNEPQKLNLDTVSIESFVNQIAEYLV